MAAPPGSTWVRLRRLERACYAENGGPLDDEIRPVFVRILAARNIDRAALGDEAKRIVSAVASVTGHHRSNVHVIYEPDARGRVAFGGRLVE